MDGLEELVGDPRDRDLGDLELLLAQQVQQQVERAGERVELDDERRCPAPSAVVGASDEAVMLAEAHAATTPDTGRSRRRAALRIAYAGVSRNDITGWNRNMRTKSGR